jgi:hypothetical protein
MKNFLNAFIMCLFSVVSFSQAEKNKSEVNSIKVAEKSIDNSSGKPVYKNTGNPVEDQRVYDEAKAKYINEQADLKSHSIKVEEKTAIENKIKQIDSHINSINIKTEYVLNHPEDKKVAEQQGWFEDMKKTKEQLELKKAELIKSLEK